MRLLKETVSSHRIVLHITDITLLEVKRQISELVLAQQRDLLAVEKHFARWRKSAPSVAPKSIPQFDANALALELFREFDSFLRHECRAMAHSALGVDPNTVFDAYFARRAPFDGENSKEFPDAFAIEALSQWRAKADKQIYVVTHDRAMKRAALDRNLLQLEDIHEVLVRAAADLGAEGETAAEAVLNNPAFENSLGAVLGPLIKEIGYVYMGDLAEGEAYEGELLSVEEVYDWSVVGLNNALVTLILDVKVKVRVEIGYEDRDGAMYDREDGLWVGSEVASTKVDDEVEMQALVEVDRKSGVVGDARVLSHEVSIYGPDPYS